MFNARSVLTYLEVLEKAYGPCGAELFRKHLERLDSLDPGTHLNPESQVLRDAISGLRGAALELNDRLTQRFFNASRAQTWAQVRAI
jgi:hypothetical protein